MRHVRRHKVREAVGRGANEVLARVAAFAAFSAGGKFTIEQEFYEAIPGWITGMAMMAARQADCLPISATKSAKGGSEAASVNAGVLLASPPTMLGPRICAFGRPHGRAF